MFPMDTAPEKQGNTVNFSCVPDQNRSILKKKDYSPFLEWFDGL